MPSLGTKDFGAKAKDGTKVSFKTDVYVTAEGEFTFSIPTELEELFSRCQAAKTRAGRLSAKTLDDGINTLRYLALELISGEEKTETVIVYGTLLEVAFWTDSTGKIWPNGSGRNGGKWNRFKSTSKAIHATERTTNYCVGITAGVFYKTTTFRASGDTVRYKEVDDMHKETPAMMLNSFTGLNVDTANIGSNFQPNKEMPYTPEAALFFYGILIGLCRLASEIDSVLGDKEQLQLAINSGVKLLQPAK